MSVLTTYEFYRTSIEDKSFIAIQQAVQMALSPLVEDDVAVFIMYRDDTGAIRQFFQSNGDEKSVGALAKSLGGAASVVEESLDFLTESKIVQAKVKPRQVLNRAMGGAEVNPKDFAMQLSLQLGIGEWIGFATRATKPHIERGRYRSYVEAVREGMTTHYSSGANELLTCSIYGGASNFKRARSLINLAVHGLPGFDLDLYYEQITKTIPTIFLTALSVLSIGLSFFNTPLPRYFYYIAATVFCIILGLYRATKISKAEKIKTNLIPPRLKIFYILNKNKPLYPLAKDAILLPMVSPASLCAPLDGTGVTRKRKAPIALLSTDGPEIGEGIKLSYPDFIKGLSVIGSPGSGKSVLLENLAGYIWNLQKTSKDFSLIIFEPKADGLKNYLDLYKTNPANLFYTVIAGNKKLSNGFSMLDTNLPPDVMADVLVNGMKNSMEEGSIQARATDSLKTLLTVSFYIDNQVIDKARNNYPLPEIFPYDASIITYAHILSGGLGADEAGLALANALKDKLFASTDLKMQEAASRLESFYGAKKTARDRATLLESSRNKLSQLLKYDHLFTANSWGWREVLENNLNLIILSGDYEETKVTDEDEKTIVSMLSYTLRSTIQNFSHSKIFLIFDEISLMNKGASDVLEWMRDKGRSYGVRPIYATQRPDQLSETLRKAFLTFPTFISFKADEAGIAEEIATQFSATGETWQPSEIINLPRYTAIVKTTIDGETQTPFTVETYWWRKRNV